jgi:hypothetical protein
VKNMDWAAVSYVVNALLGLLALVAALKWRYIKAKLSALREFIDALDEALKDDRISEEEFNRLFDLFKKLFATVKK